jgi:hypothetical protein
MPPTVITIALTDAEILMAERERLAAPVTLPNLAAWVQAVLSAEIARLGAQQQEADAALLGAKLAKASPEVRAAVLTELAKVPLAGTREANT